MMTSADRAWFRDFEYLPQRGRVCRRNRMALLKCLSAILLCLSFVPAVAQETSGGQTPAASTPKAEPEAGKPENPFPNRIPAPSLDGGIEWLNTSQPLSLKDLRGKVVVLDFWTYCCINCIHVLPDLKYLEKKYGKELVVIGVHSAKFDNEKETGNIRKAILRYEIEHPVVNDAEMTIWRKFSIRSWPSLVLIDPEGQFCGVASGEGNRELLDQVIAKVIDYHRAKGTLNEKPMAFDLESGKEAATPLRFPGKLLVDPTRERVFISDSNHNRIVVASLSGQLIQVIGNGKIGAKDGPAESAQFDHPQGMALEGNTLYVADTENHLLRTVNLTTWEVSTLAGTGEQARGRDRGGELRTTALNSPWDLYIHQGVLYVAMAGPHQLWSHALGSKTIQNYAGSGREDITNGSLAQSALAQPSGITSDGESLYVVDSEGSSIRKITTSEADKLEDPEGKVTTVVGASDLPRGASLFEFGDIDGKGSAVRLQHPLGIVFHEGKLYVADSYNHKVKVIDPIKRTCESWLGNGKPGAVLDPVQLSEPAGLATYGGVLFIADTNNHRVLKVDLKTKRATEFKIEGLAAPKP
ncbi:hypothetical protein A6X21_10350 [Planctopirus hydrillae]|uniref:Thioredoxin domain-containing protein n=2 Tax=Planctopirus hydrillae TaxID=1841610 RepID=A0A1C3E6Z8_9PLAN|nr:hypothetical protein A6X21_10350 [Planctopirus hydrillae]